MTLVRASVLRFAVACVRSGLAAITGRFNLRRIVFGICSLSALAFAPTPAAALLAPTTTSVTASASPSPSGSPVTFTATVTSGAGTPDGTVIFLADLLSLGIGSLDGAGKATFTTSTLPIGVHSIVAVYVGNLNFTTSTSIGLNINISLAACTLSVAASVNTLTFGTSVNLTATVSGGGATPTGNITIRAGLTVLGNVALGGGGQGVLSISTLPVGLLSISADYGGDGNFLPCIAPVIVITVNKSPSTSAVTSSLNPSTIGVPVTYTATVSGSGGTPTGNVTFKDGATVIGAGALDGSGHATLVTGSLGTGGHSISVNYVGDTNFVGSSSPALAQTVNQGSSTTALASSGSPAASGSAVTFTATVTGSGAVPSGTVTFKDGATTVGTGTLNGSGQAALVTSALALGTHSITAVYGGDVNFTGSISSALAQVTVAASSTTALVAAPNPAVAGSAVTFTATVTGSGGTPTGAVTFKDGATTLGAVPLDGAGRAVLATSALASGSHSITATYGGDTTFSNSISPAVALQINPAGGTASATTLAATPNPGAPGAPVTVTATVTGTGGTPTGTVTFKDGAATIGTAALDGAGHAVFVTSSLSNGSHSIVAVYGGDTIFASSTSPALALQINPAGGTASGTTLAATPNPGAAGAPVTFTATVTGSGGTPTGTVTFKDGATTIGTAALDGTGRAVLVTNSLSSGNHSVTAAYGGDMIFANSTSPALALQINAAGSTASATALTAAPNPGVAGAPVTFTASVTGAGATPTGTITFKDGAATIGTAALNSSGRAVLAASSLSNGSHSITAVYGGDSFFAPSVSAPLGFTINPLGTGTAATTTTLSSSANPSVSGQPVTFTAAVAASTGSPTGSVTFKDGAQVLGRATLAGNAASLTLTSLVAGSHSITATYGGDATFAPSVSAPIVQSISVPPDSAKLRKLQEMATRIVAQNAGQAISGAIDAAIDEGFADGNQMITPSELGLRLSSSGSTNVMVWSDLRYAALNSDASRQDVSGGQVNALAGITYRIVPNLLVGFLSGYESFNYDVASLNGHLRGGGWTAGGYVGWRVLPGIRFDAGVAQSGIEYQGVAGSAAGAFPGSRTLVTTALTGTWRLMPGLELEPSARVYALWEKQEAYTDSLGTSQSERSFSTGRASVGAKLTYRWALSSTTALAPFAGLYADNYFTRDDVGTASLPAVMQGSSARVVGGVAVTTDHGLKFSTAAELGGIGGNFTSWSVRARGAVPF